MSLIASGSERPTNNSRAIGKFFRFKDEHSNVAIGEVFGSLAGRAILLAASFVLQNEVGAFKQEGFPILDLVRMKPVVIRQFIQASSPLQKLLHYLCLKISAIASSAHHLALFPDGLNFLFGSCLVSHGTL